MGKITHYLALYQYNSCACARKKDASKIEEAKEKALNYIILKRISKN